MRIVVISLLSVVSNITFIHAQDVSSLDEIHVQNEGKWSLVSLVNTITKQQKDEFYSSVSAADVGSDSDPYKQVVSYPFTDIAQSVYADDITLLYRLGIVKGCAQDRFCPQNNLKRYEFVSMLIDAMRVKGLKIPIVSLPLDDSSYSDISPMAPFALKIYQAKALGLLDAIEQKQKGIYTIQPDAVITDAEVVGLIRVALGYTPKPISSLKDVLLMNKGQGSFLLVHALGLQPMSVTEKNTNLIFDSVDTQKTSLGSASVIAPSVLGVEKNSFTYWLMNTVQSRF